MACEYIVKISDEVMEKIPSFGYPPPELIRCKDCKHKPIIPDTIHHFADIVFPDDECPCKCDDPYYNWIPNDDFFCANGERK